MQNRHPYKTDEPKVKVASAAQSDATAIAAFGLVSVLVVVVLLINGAMSGI